MTIPYDRAPKVVGRFLSIDDGQGFYRVAGWNADGRVGLFQAGTRDLELLRRCDGTRNLDTLAIETTSSIDETMAALSSWHNRIPRSFGWKVVDMDDKTSRHQEAARQMLREIEAVELRTRTNVDNQSYHVNDIRDALEQFENVETTVSHAYAEPHPALRGRTYGQAFFDKCRALSLLKPGMQIAEIGCGTGRFARAFLDRFAAEIPEAYRTSRYVLFDLSPALTESQRIECSAHDARTRFENGDIETGGPSGPFDLIIMNEMIADLHVDTFTRAEVTAARAETRRVREYGLSLDGALDRFLVNTGAIRAIERLPSLLRPGGSAIISEYGSIDEFPYSVQLGDHIEYSIHFGHLMTVATQLGFDTKTERLTGFLGFSPSLEVVARGTMALMRFVWRELFGIELAARAYDREQLRQVLVTSDAHLGDICFARIDELESFMSPEAFHVLLLRDRRE